MITPVGIALRQGDVGGKLRWDELKDLKLEGSVGTGSFALSSHSNVLLGIQLEVEGATIVIVDIYARPLAVIHAALRNYWRGPKSKEES